MIGISSCLAGENCTYRGDSNLIPMLKELYEKGQAVLICPEVLGGLPIPRDPAEITSEYPLRVTTCKGVDVTGFYQEGARKAFELLKNKKITAVILKSNSPSCGAGSIYDGTFSHTCITNDGIFARLLRQNGIELVTEKETEKIRKIIEEVL